MATVRLTLGTGGGGDQRHALQRGGQSRVANVAFAATNGAACWQRARITTSGTTAVISVKVWVGMTV